MIKKKWLDQIDQIRAEYPVGQVTRTGYLVDGEKPWVSTNTACHAGLYGVPRNAKATYLFTLYQPQHEGIDEATSKLFIDWMVNKSPYAEIFVLKDPDKIYQKAYLSRMDVPANFLVAGNIATRFLSESYARSSCYAWCELVKGGADPTYAYIMAMGLSANSAENPYPIRNGGSGDTHHGISYRGESLTKSYNFIKGKKSNLLPNFNERWGYGNLDSIWYEAGAKKATSLTDYLARLKPKEIKKHMSFQIFDNYKAKPGNYGSVVANNRDDLMNCYEQFKLEIDGMEK